ncbi:MAG: hypothetical protein R6W70_11250 [bacterium]
MFGFLKKIRKYIDTSTFAAVFFTAVILIRNILETAVMSRNNFLSYHVIIHHFFWYLSAFVFYLLCFRFIAGMKIKHLHRLSFAAPVVWIPLIHSLLSGQSLQLDYLRGNPEYIFRQMLTLMYGHPANHHFFYELLILGVGIAVITFIVSRSFFLTVLNTIAAFYGSMAAGGLHIAGKAPSRLAYIEIKTAMTEQQLMAHIFYAAAVLLFFFLIFPETLHKFRRKTLKKPELFVSTSIFAIIAFSIYCISVETSPVLNDLTLRLFPLCGAVSLPALYKKENKIPYSIKMPLVIFFTGGVFLLFPAFVFV